MRYQFTAAQKAEISEARRKNKEKRTEQRLLALSPRADGSKQEEVARRIGFQRCSVSVLVRKYFQGGLAAIVGSHCGGNRRNMSMADEAALLEEYLIKAEQGRMLDVRELELAKPKYCWRRKGSRPNVPCHHIREYRYAYGAVIHAPEIPFSWCCLRAILSA